MLARRFTIVCLLTAIFGMCLSGLVARSGDSFRDVPFQAGCKLGYRAGC